MCPRAGSAALAFCPSPARTLLKPFFEHLVVASHIPSLLRRSHVRDALILAYHNVLPHGVPVCGDRSLHLARDVFAAQLDALAETHDVVPLATLLAPPGATRRPRACITFDDAYHGAVTAGIEELESRGMAATIFVAPAFVGDRSFWWDAISAGEGEGLSDEVRSHALVALRGDDSAVRAWAIAQGRIPIEPPRACRCASEEDLAAVTRRRGIVLASHSWSHRNLASLSDAELRDELARPLTWLRARFERVIPWLAYPYGLVSAPATRIAEEVGYAAACRVRGGWSRIPLADRFGVPRLNVPAGLSRQGFALRTAGLFAA